MPRVGVGSQAPPDTRGGVVLLAGPGDLTNIVFHALEGEFGIESVILERPVPRWQLVRGRWRRLGPAVVAGQLAFRAGLVPWLRRASRTRVEQICAALGLDRSPPPESIVARVESANASETTTLLRGVLPKVVVVNGTRILSGTTLGAVPAVWLNTHAGITPTYRGVHGGYWALTRGDRDHCGVTVHLVDRGIDTGRIVAQARIQPTSADTFLTYPYLQIGAALPLLRRAVADALAGTLETVAAAPGPSRLWSHPTLPEYLRYRWTLGIK